MKKCKTVTDWSGAWNYREQDVEAGILLTKRCYYSILLTYCTLFRYMCSFVCSFRGFKALTSSWVTTFSFLEPPWWPSDPPAPPLSSCSPNYLHVIWHQRYRRYVRYVYAPRASSSYYWCFRGGAVGINGLLVLRRHKKYPAEYAHKKRYLW